MKIIVKINDEDIEIEFVGKMIPKHDLANGWYTATLELLENQFNKDELAIVLERYIQNLKKYTQK